MMMMMMTVTITMVTNTYQPSSEPLAYTKLLIFTTALREILSSTSFYRPENRSKLPKVTSSKEKKQDLNPGRQSGPRAPAFNATLHSLSGWMR